eukprot:scaffold26127_cov69-Phaeocystis_antarctica.AAC.2
MGVTKSCEDTATAAGWFPGRDWPARPLWRLLVLAAGTVPRWAGRAGGMGCQEGSHQLGVAHDPSTFNLSLIHI